MKKIFYPIISLFISCALISCQSSKDWTKEKKDFVEMPTKMRPAPLWFWNNSTVEHDELKRQIASFKEAGYGGLSILPFGVDFKPKYLTDEYFDVYRTCIEEAERQGITLCLYDEYGFPSGTAGDVNGDGVGRFKIKYPDYTNKRLDRVQYFPTNKGKFTTEINDKYLMAIVAMDTITHQRINLKDQVKGNQLTWDVPEEAWKVMTFNCVDAGNTVMDYLDPKAAELYIGMTHEEYYKRFGKYFGNVIEGTFFDEPTMYYADGRTWTPEFNTKFETVKGFDPALLYPALFEDIGETTVQDRNDLFGFRSDLFAEGYLKKVSEWSNAHGVHATGHLDNEEMLNAVGTSGDYMKAFKYQDIPGIDKIGGGRPTEGYYKIATSAAYNWDKSLVMTETYGDMGNIGWDKIFSIAMEQYAKGVNMLIPHAVWYNTERVTFLPELSQRNPIYADSIPVMNEYLTRLNVMMRNDARWMGDIAVLYPVNTMEADHYFGGPLSYYQGGVEIPYLEYTKVSQNLLDSLGYDHLFIHPEILDERCVIEGNKLKLENEVQYNTFSTMVVPASRAISLSNLEKIKNFATQGGIVIFTSQLPTVGTKVADNAKVEALIKEIQKMDNVYFIKDPSVKNLQNVLAKYENNYNLNFVKDPVMNIHKVREGKNLWFLANPSSDAKHSEFRIRGNYDLMAWDPHSGQTVDVPLDVKKENGETIVKIDLPAIRSIFLLEK